MMVHGYTVLTRKQSSNLNSGSLLDREPPQKFIRSRTVAKEMIEVFVSCVGYVRSACYSTHSD